MGTCEKAGICCCSCTDTPPPSSPCLWALLAQACLSIFVTGLKFDVSYFQLAASEPCMNELVIYTKCLIKSAAAAPGINIAVRLWIFFFFMRGVRERGFFAIRDVYVLYLVRLLAFVTVCWWRGIGPGPCPSGLRTADRMFLYGIHTHNMHSILLV